MGQLAHESAVQGRLMGRPWLIPVFTNALRIPERLREVNPAYFVALNVIRVLEKIRGLPYTEWTPVPPGVTPRWNAWYEVHKLNAPLWVQEGVILPFGPLDARAIRYVAERDTELVGQEVFARIDRENQEHAKRLARQRRNLASAIAADIRPIVAMDYWGRNHFGPVPLSRR